MNESTFTKLGVAAAIMVIAAALVGAYDPQPDFDNSGTRDLIQDINPSNIDTVEVMSDGETAKLVRQGSSFVVASKLNYPASVKEINSVIEKCMKIRTDARITDDASDHEELEVREDDPDVQRVRFLDRDGKLIVGVIVAEEPKNDQGSGYFVRLEGEDAVYHTTEYISFRGKSLQYVDKSIVDLARDDTARVHAQNASGEYTILSPEKGTVELQNVPEGKKVKGSSHESVFGVAQRLEFADFLSATEAKDLNFDAVLEVETRSKAVYRFETAMKVEPSESPDVEGAKTYYVRASAKYVGPEQVQMSPDADEEEKKRLEGLMLARDAVDAFNQKHQSWIYELPSYKATAMRKPLEELLEDEAPPQDVGDEDK